MSTLSVVHTGDPTLVKNVGTDRLNSSPDVRDAGMQLAHGGLTHRRPQTPGTWRIYLRCFQCYFDVQFSLQCSPDTIEVFPNLFLAKAPFPEYVHCGYIMQLLTRQLMIADFVKFWYVFEIHKWTYRHKGHNGGWSNNSYLLNCCHLSNSS